MSYLTNGLDNNTTWDMLYDITLHDTCYNIVAFAERHPKLVARKNRDFSGRTFK